MVSHFFKVGLCFIIQIYQTILSPWVGGQCRFSPTCSHYARDAVMIHGPIRGVWLAARRLCKCHPYYQGNCLDPVPGQKGKV